MGFREESGYLDEIVWHTNGDYPAGLPREAAATHMGMFLAWAVFNKLASTRHYDKKSAAVKRLKARSTLARRRRVPTSARCVRSG
jgi:hypothetical protein